MEENNTKATQNETNPVQEKKDNKKDDKKNDKKSFSSLVGQYKGEFRKIIWPSREDLVKQTITVIVVSLLIGAIISGYDYIFSFIFEQLVNLTA